MHHFMALMKALKIQTDNLVVEVEHWHDDQAVVESIPTGGNFLAEFILLFPMWAFVDNIENFVHV